MGVPAERHSDQTSARPDRIQPTDPSGPPGGEALRVLGGDPGRGAIGPPEDDGHRLQPGGHVVGLGGGVDDLVDGLHGEVKGHELTDGPEAGL